MIGSRTHRAGRSAASGLAVFAGILGAWSSVSAQTPRFPGLRHAVESPGSVVAVPVGARVGTGSIAEDGGASIGAMTAVGIAVGAAGLLVGGLVGGALADDGGDLDALSGILVGGAIGEAVGIPLGAHLANDRRGSYPSAAAASLGLAGLGLAALGAAHYDAPASPVILVVVPLAQLAASIAIEHATADRNRQEER